MDKELEDLIYSPNTTGKDINDYFYRIDKEEFFLSIIKDYVINDFHPDYVFYFNSNNDLLFQLDKNYSTLWCNYSLVWDVFYDKYGMNYDEIQSFLENRIKYVLNITQNLNIVSMELDNGF